MVENLVLEAKGQGREFRVAVIYGSPRRGLSYAAAQGAIEALGREGDKGLVAGRTIRTETFWLSQLDIPLCKGCMQCFEVGEHKCPHRALLEPIATALHQADLVIMTSPVYALQVSAHVKNLLDHFAYYFHRPFAFNKSALVIVGTAGGGASAAANYMRDTLKHWGFNRVAKVALMGMGEKTLNEKQHQEVVKRLQSLVSVQNAGKRRQPSLKRIIFYNLWRALNSLPTALPPDAAYWKAHGLEDSPYAPGIKLTLSRRILGNTICKLFKWMFGQPQKA